MQFQGSDVLEYVGTAGLDQGSSSGECGSSVRVQKFDYTAYDSNKAIAVGFRSRSNYGRHWGLKQVRLARVKPRGRFAVPSRTRL